MKVIFLDIDGVLNYSKCKTKIHGMYGIEENKLVLLRAIVNATHSKVVLTSTWKLDLNPDTKFEDLNEDGQYLAATFYRADIDILDKTTDNGSNRGAGIVDWLDEHPWVDKFCILDDELFDYAEYNLMPHVVKTSFYDGGLKLSHVSEAVKILGGKE